MEEEMVSFPSFDPEGDSIRMNGCANIMLTILMKAKFGDRFDHEMLFHENLSNLIRQIDNAVNETPRVPGECFIREDLALIAKGVAEGSYRNGWWSMDGAQREQYLQSAAAPWVLSGSQIQDIIDDVESLLFRYRQVTSAADAAGEG